MAWFLMMMIIVSVAAGAQHVHTTDSKGTVAVLAGLAMIYGFNHDERFFEWALAASAPRHEQFFEQADTEAYLTVATASRAARIANVEGDWSRAAALTGSGTIAGRGVG